MRATITASALTLVLAWIVPAGAPKQCLNKPCARSRARAQRRADRCFRASGACTMDIAHSVICWENGARFELSPPPLRVNVTRRYAPDGTLCDTGISDFTQPSGFHTKYTRGHRSWSSSQTTEGLVITCGGGKRDFYSAKHLALPECADGETAGSSAFDCPVGTCP